MAKPLNLSSFLSIVNLAFNLSLLSVLFALFFCKLFFQESGSNPAGKKSQRETTQRELTYYGSDTEGAFMNVCSKNSLFYLLQEKRVQMSF